MELFVWGKKFRDFMELYNGSDGTEQLCLALLLFRPMSVCLSVRTHILETTRTNFTKCHGHSLSGARGWGAKPHESRCQENFT